MSVETTLLQLLKYRGRHERLSGVVPSVGLDPTTVIFLDDFGAFFKEYPDAVRIEYEPFMLWFKAFRHPTLTSERLELFRELLRDALTKDCEPSLESGLIERLNIAEMMSRTTDLITRWNEGAEIDAYVALRDEVERFEKNTQRKVVVPWVEADIDALLLQDLDGKGLKWRLQCLADTMRPLRGGDAIIWAARPGKGKTSGLLSEVTHMSAQFDEYYGPGHGRYALWLNNEGPGDRVFRRAFQSALNATDAEMIKKSLAGTLRAEYAAAVGGLDRIRIMDIHDFWNHDVEALFRRVPPGLVVFDMVDNIKFREIGGGSSDKRTDQVLESMYQWVRNMAVKYGFPAVSTSQVSAEGAGLQFPADHMLKDSKTGKQGACDAIVMTGHSSDPAYSNNRWMSVVKSKLQLPGKPESPHAEVLFDGERGRLLMPTDRQ